MKTLLASFRVPFLVLTPACVFLGFSTAKASDVAINSVDALLALIGALAAHISVNTFNEYLDFRSGLDAQTRRTPFSGGSGALVVDPAAEKIVLRAALLSLGLTALIGGYFLLLRGLAILPIGLAGMLIIVTYTQWLNRCPLPCLLAPGLGFGFLMVTGTHFVLTGQYNSLALAAALVLGINSDLFPKLAYIALIPMLAAFLTWLGAIRFAWSDAKNIETLLPFMALNVVAAVMTPVFLGVAILI